MKDYAVEFFIGLSALAVGMMVIFTLMSNLNALTSTCLIAGGFLGLFSVIALLDTDRKTNQRSASGVAQDTDDSADYRPYHTLNYDESSDAETAKERLSPHGAKIISRRPM